MINDLNLKNFACDPGKAPPLFDVQKIHKLETSDCLEYERDLKGIAKSSILATTWAIAPTGMRSVFS